MYRINVVGMGPGREDMMTIQAKNALDASDVIIGYTVYVNLLSDEYKDKEILSTPMKQEVDRCRLCIDKAREGKTVSLICSGDSGVYGMASLMFEVAAECDDIEIAVIPGITAAVSGGAVLGAPLGHDFCTISLSDLLTPWEKIEVRLRLAAAADFGIVLYNPSSKKRADYLRKACEILLQELESTRICGYVQNIGRDNENYTLCTLEELKDKSVDMFTTVFIGSSMSYRCGDHLVTSRGYRENERF